MQRKGPGKELVSAGGVVYRVHDGSVDVVACRRRSPPVWGLPKGTPEAEETREETAVREVNEETGLNVDIEAFIGSIDYWFPRFTDGARCHKTVIYYLMRATGGDFSRHDHEFDEVRWFSASEALKTLNYDNEVGILEKGLSLVSEKNGPWHA